MTVVNEKVILLYPLVHHLYCSTLITARLSANLKHFLSLLRQFAQFALVFQHQELILNFWKFFGDGNIDDSFHGFYHGDFCGLGCFDRFIDELFGIDFVAPAFSYGRLKESLLFDKLFIVLSFEHYYFIIK